MENLKILADSCCDLPKEVLDKNNIEYVEMTYVLDGVEYSSFQNEISYEEFYDRLATGSKASTSCINEATFTEKFTELTADGSSVLYIAFSSALSVTYNNAVKAAKVVNDSLGKEKIFVYDSLSASMGQGYQVLEASKLAKDGKNAKFIMNELKHTTFFARFTVKDLMYLKRGGRLSGFSAVVGKMLNVQPMLNCADTEGTLKVVDKVIGKKAMYPYFVKKLTAEIEEVENPTIYILHGHNMESVDILREEILKVIPKANIITYFIGHVIGAHCGKGVIALFYKGK